MARLSGIYTIMIYDICFGIYIGYLWFYDLCAPFSCGQIQYEGTWEGVGPLEIETFLGPVKGQASAIWGPKKGPTNQTYKNFQDPKKLNLYTSVWAFQSKVQLQYNPQHVHTVS